MSVQVEPAYRLGERGSRPARPKTDVARATCVEENRTKIGGPLAGVTVATRVAGFTSLITPVIVCSLPAAQATAAIKKRPRTAAAVTTILFSFMVLTPTF